MKGNFDFKKKKEKRKVLPNADTAVLLLGFPPVGGACQWARGGRSTSCLIAINICHT